MKKILLIIMGTLCLLNAKPLKVGTSPDTPPFQYMKDGKLEGFEYELVNEIARISNLTLEWIPMSFDGIIAALNTGKIDIGSSSFAITKERQKVCDFTTPIFFSDNAFIKLKDNINLKTKDDLIGKKIAVELGSIQEQNAKQIKDAKIIGSEGIINVIFSVTSKRADALLLDSVMSIEYLNKYPELEIFIKEPDGSDGMAIAFKKGSQYKQIFDAALKTLKDNGFFDTLLKKHGLDKH